MFRSPGAGSMLEGWWQEGIREGVLFLPGKSGGACYWKVRGQEYKKMSECPTSSPAFRVLAVAFTSGGKTQRAILYIRDFSNFT